MGSRISHCLIVYSLMTYAGGRTKSTERSMILRRFSGWIMCGVRRMYCHLPDRVLKQYGYVQTVPRHLTDVVELPPPHIVQAFVDFRTHTLKAADWGEQAGEQTWRMAMCYDGPGGHEPSAVVSGHEPYEGADRADFDQEARPGAEKEAPLAGP
uniref:IMP dehydrogenase/GMP reductase, putative n=1 Tax=Medicago truncatula TaxID=3880 RepID=A2Q6F9_MEDTR|nr:IMP dehydrogenase/GMP reductase, putative [Medicago truncatula]